MTETIPLPSNPRLRAQRSEFIQVKSLCAPWSVSRNLAVRLPAILLVWAQSGSAEVTFKNHRHVLREDRLVFIEAGRDVALLPEKCGGVHVLAFSADFLLMLGKQYSFPLAIAHPCPVGEPLPGFAEMPLPEHVSTMMQVVVSQSPQIWLRKMEMLKGLLQTLIAYLHRHRQVHAKEEIPQTTDQFLFQSFVGLLEKHYAVKKNVSDYAAALAVTPSRLCDAVRRASGTSASSYIRQHITNEAKRIVLGSSASMKEVAYQVGFMDIAHFSKFFRSQSGMTFTNYKQLWV